MLETCPLLQTLRQCSHHGSCISSKKPRTYAYTTPPYLSSMSPKLMMKAPGMGCTSCQLPLQNA
jgi:hypothetical protein